MKNDKQTQQKLTLMVSSTVEGMEELLDRIYAMLTVFGYEVWMSHKGTIPVNSNRTAFESCLDAVSKCDLFLGIITPFYGSGLDGNLSITHQEILKAIALNKPRWLLAHDHVVFARALLNNLGYDSKAKRRKLKLKANRILSDLRVIDLYEDATIEQSGKYPVPLAERKGNWVQKFYSNEDGGIFVSAQFFRYQEVEKFIEENFGRGHPAPSERSSQ